MSFNPFWYRFQGVPGLVSQPWPLYSAMSYNAPYWWAGTIPSYEQPTPPICQGWGEMENYHSYQQLRPCCFPLTSHIITYNDGLQYRICMPSAYKPYLPN